MNSHEGPIEAYRRYWLPELIVLIALGLATTVLFAVTDLDISSIRPYFHPELADPWPVSNHPVWRVFYRSAPWVTASLAVAGVALLIVGTVRGKSGRYRWYGLFLLLCVAIGPGLIINATLKDHWGRPRPRQLVQFGGQLEYAAPLLPAGEHGKSFPCGHCSVGYLYAAGWWFWRRRHPWRGTLSLAVGLVTGTLLGIGRMAAGAHFLSDAVWSALIAYGTAHVLYYYILRIPAREDSQPALYPLIGHNPRLKAAVIGAGIVLGLGIIAGGMLASPCDRELGEHVRLSAYPEEPRIVEVHADTLDLELRLVAKPSDEITVSGAMHGFGPPNSEIRARWDFERRPVPMLRYRIVEEGFFTDVDGNAVMRIPVGEVKKIIVRIGHGDISLVNEAGGSTLPELDLVTSRGFVHRSGNQSTTP